ncbi:hypothetical protein ACVGWN_09755, partial [Enterobacter hormaechei]
FVVCFFFFIYFFFFGLIVFFFFMSFFGLWPQFKVFLFLVVSVFDWVVKLQKNVVFGGWRGVRKGIRGKNWLKRGGGFGSPPHPAFLYARFLRHVTAL